MSTTSAGRRGDKVGSGGVVRTRIEPAPTETTDAFWDATRDGQYLVQWCTACDEPIFYPRPACPQCLSPDSLEWRTSSGAGTVYAVSAQYRPANPTMADRVPYVVALIEVDAGAGGRTIRVLSNVVDCEPSAVAVGDTVHLAWEPLSDGRRLAVFAPDRVSHDGAPATDG